MREFGQGRDDASQPPAAFPPNASIPIEAAPDAMLVADGLGRIVLINARVEALFGYSRGELIGSPIEMLLPERLRSMHTAHIARYSAEPRARLIGVGGPDLLGRRKDGAEFAAEISLSPLKTEQGAFVVACIRDVTERRKGEEAVRMGEELRQAHEEREDLQRALSHDLRSPLSVIHLQAQRLMRLVEGPDVRQGLAAILTSTTRMEAMIQDLVESARLDGGHVEKRPLVLRAFCRELVSRSAGVLDATRIEDDLPEALAVAADPACLERILTNLLTNALKYSPPESKVGIRAERQSDEVVVAVTDHGSGLPPEDLSHLFDRFWRAHRTCRTEGLGLGLFITKRLVTAHGGRIWVESQLGQGSCFRFTLPPG
jgi:PAS domain S-box-containing protein